MSCADIIREQRYCDSSDGSSISSSFYFCSSCNFCSTKYNFPSGLILNFILTNITSNKTLVRNNVANSCISLSMKFLEFLTVDSVTNQLLWCSAVQKLIQ